MIHDNDELALFDALGVGHLAREKNLNAWLSFVAADKKFVAKLADEANARNERVDALLAPISFGRIVEG